MRHALSSDPVKDAAEQVAALKATGQCVFDALLRQNRRLCDVGFAGRIDAAEAEIERMTVAFARAVHAVALTAIGNPSTIDEDFASVVAERIADAVLDEYVPAWDRQRVLAEDAERERAA